MPRRNEYTDTVRDLKALLRTERDAEKREELASNLDKMNTQLERQRDQLTDLKVLKERVAGLTWLVRGLFLACAVELISLIVKGHS